MTTTRPSDLAGLLVAAREGTAALTDPVGEADLVAQHSPLMSPLVWDLAHIGSQEEIWLLRGVAGHEPMRPEIDTLYDAFRHPRAERVTLPLLGPAEARAYDAEVRARVLDVLARTRDGDLARDAPDPLLRDGFVYGMVAQHERQHGETMLATHQLRQGPPVLAAPDPPPCRAGVLPRDVLVPAGEFVMGTDDHPFALDNERPAHRVHVPAFRIDTTPVTNAGYRAFVEDGGYDDRRWWTAEGWAERHRAGWTAPRFWERDGATWARRRFGIREEVPPDEPVAHVSWYEADAYARWAGRRLPTEAEWEKAARHDPATGRTRVYPWGDEPPGERHANLGRRHLRPAPAGAYPAGASAVGAHQMIGDVWEWTATWFTGYPGFIAFPYAEYSEVFLGGDYRVLRGGSFATDPVVARATFRNWDFPRRRQIFAGFRTAADVED